MKELRNLKIISVMSTATPILIELVKLLELRDHKTNKEVDHKIVKLYNKLKTIFEEQEYL